MRDPEVYCPQYGPIHHNRCHTFVSSATLRATALSERSIHLISSAVSAELAENVDATVDNLFTSAAKERSRVNRKYRRRADLLHAGEVRYGINSGLRRTFTPPAEQALRTIDKFMERERDRRAKRSDTARGNPKPQRPKGAPSAVGAWNKSSFGRIEAAAEYRALQPISSRLSSTMPLPNMRPLPVARRSNVQPLSCVQPLSSLVPISRNLSKAQRTRTHNDEVALLRTGAVRADEVEIARGLGVITLKRAMSKMNTLTKEVSTMHFRTFCPGKVGLMDAQFLEIERISRKTGLPTKKVRELFATYTVATGSRGALSPVAFEEILQKCKMSKQLLARIFSLLDTSDSRKLSFEQFAEGICLFISGSREAQAKVLFKLMDVSGDNVVDKLELLRFFVGGLTATKEERRIVGRMVNEIMRLMDADGSGEISLEEFVFMVGTDEEVWKMFKEISPITQLIRAMGLDSVVGKTDSVTNGVEELLIRMQTGLDNASANASTAKEAKSKKQQMKSCMFSGVARSHK